MLVNLIKRVIASDDYDKEDMQEKLDVFLLFGRLTKEEYEELIELMK